MMLKINLSNRYNTFEYCVFVCSSVCPSVCNTFVSVTYLPNVWFDLKIKICTYVDDHSRKPYVTWTECLSDPYLSKVLAQTSKSRDSSVVYIT